MTFEEAFKKMTQMAGGRRCILSYSRYSDAEYGDYPAIYVLITKEDGSSLCTRTVESFEVALVEMAILIAGHKDEPEIEG